MEFKEFPKIGRLRQQCTITEKIDGINAQICFYECNDMLVGSRKRQIYPESTPGMMKGCDKYGFAKWVYDNRSILQSFLGEGQNYGEWAGQGIRRNYGLTEKRFYLFNSFRFAPDKQAIPEHLHEAGLRVVPILYQGDFSMHAIEDTMTE